MIEARWQIEATLGLDSRFTRYYIPVDGRAQGCNSVTNGRFISYLRVSTDDQGDNGHGLDAQRDHVRRYLNGGSWTLLAEFVEIETGKHDDRPELAKAMAACRVMNATLLVGKLDRLSRRASFLLKARDAEFPVICCDNPNMSRMEYGLRAVWAEEEREMISRRTREGLQAAKRKGVVLGNPANLTAVAQAKGRAMGREALSAKADQRAADVMPIIADLEAAGASTLAQIAEGLNARQVLTARGGAWSATQVMRLKARTA